MTPGTGERRPIRAVLFDVDNTLRYLPEELPGEEVYRVSARRVAQVLAGLDGGVSVDAAAFVRHVGQAAFAVPSAAPEYRSPDYVGLVRSLLREYGVDATPDQARAVWHAWFVPVEVLGVRPFPDAAETLRWLRERGYRLACVTNRPLGGDVFLRELEQHGLLEFFDAWAVSCDLGYEKPNPAIFRCALDALGAAPEEAAMVGDSLAADVAGAQRLGMAAVWKRPLRAVPVGAVPAGGEEVRPDYVIDHLTELRSLPLFA